MEDALESVADLVILIGMASQLPRLQTLPMGEMPEAREGTRRLLEQHAKWNKSTEHADFRLLNAFIDRARDLQMS